MLTITGSASFVRVRDYAGATVPVPRPATPATAPVIDWDAATQARLSAARVVVAAEKLSSLLDARLARGEGNPDIIAAIARSNSDLGLSTTSTAARVSSTEEVNASPTSFTPRRPDFGGITSNVLTVGGEYDASSATTTLEFRVGLGGVRGVSDIRIDIYDGASLIDSVTVDSADPVDRVYDLANGLTFSLGNGTAVIGDSATVDVFDNVGSVVNPDGAFDGEGNDHPELQHGFAVSANTFRINGNTISVAADDSINSVLAAINASAADVTATFDVASERIEIVHNTLGSDSDIIFKNDKSGFLAATKLEGATVIPGTDSDLHQTLSKVAAFDSVSNGDLTVNGQTIAVKVNKDSLDDVISRINNASAGALASLSSDGERMEIGPFPAGAGATLVLDEGGTGLLTALKITPGTYGTDASSGEGISARRASRIADAIEDLNEALAGLFSGNGFGAVPGVETLRGSIRSILGDALENSEIREARFGLRALERDAAPLEIVNRGKLGRGLRHTAQPLLDLFGTVDDDGGRGLLGALHTTLLNSRDNLGLGGTAGEAGSLVDLFA